MIQVQNLVRNLAFHRGQRHFVYRRCGEIFAFLGPNGAGKTNTIKMLTTLLNPTSERLNWTGWTLRSIR